MLMGTQWYLLFNVIAGASAIPQDLKYTAELLELSRFERWSTLILPADFHLSGDRGDHCWRRGMERQHRRRVRSVRRQPAHVTGMGAIIAEATATGDFVLSGLRAANDGPCGGGHQPGAMAANVPSCRVAISYGISESRLGSQNGRNGIEYGREVEDRSMQRTSLPANADDKVLVDIRGVSQIYGAGERRFTAIQDVNITIKEGEFVALLGPSGCGKSTLLRIITVCNSPAPDRCCTGANLCAGSTRMPPSCSRPLHCFHG